MFSIFLRQKHLFSVVAADAGYLLGSFIRTASQLQQRNFAKNVSVRRKSLQSIIWKYYDIPRSEIQCTFRWYPVIKTIDKPQLDAVFSILEKHGYKWEDIKSNKEILQLLPSQLMERLQILSEFSINKPMLHMLLNIKCLLLCDIGFLRKQNIYHQHLNVMRHLLKNVEVLDLPQYILNETRTRYGIANEVSLGELHLHLLHHYLARRYSRDIETVDSVIVKLNMSNWKPLASYPHICKVIHSLGLDFTFVESNPIILEMNPINVEHIMRKHPKVGGVSLNKIIRDYPQFVLIPLFRLEKWLTVLHKFEVTEFTFSQGYLQLFTSNSYEEAEEKLQILRKLSQWQMIKDSANLPLILHHPEGVRILLNNLEHQPWSNSLRCKLEFYYKEGEEDSDDEIFKETLFMTEISPKNFIEFEREKLMLKFGAKFIRSEEDYVRLAVWQSFDKTIHKRKINALIRIFPRVKSVDQKQLSEVLSILKQHNYSWEDIQANKTVLVMLPSQLRDRLALLEEFCIKNPQLHELVIAQVFLLSKVGSLREQKDYSQEFDALSYVLRKTKALQLPDHVLHETCQRYKDVENVSLRELYLHLLKQYLTLRFPRNYDAVQSVMSNYSLSHGQPLPACWKPLRIYPQICDVISDSLHLDFSYVDMNPCILEMDPVNVKQLLKECPDIGGAGLSIFQIVREHPKILLIPYDRIQKWINLLRSYEVVTFTFTQDYLQLFSSARYWEAEEKLNFLRKLPQWKIIKQSAKLPVILYYPGGAKKLLDYLESESWSEGLLDKLDYDPWTGFVESNLELLKLNMEDETNVNYPVEVVAYLKRYLSMDERKAYMLLHSVRKPFGVFNVQKVLQRLLDFGFTRKQILQGVDILSFEYNVVNESLEEFLSRPETQPSDQWMNNPYVIHLLIYCIKKYHKSFLSIFTK